MVLNQLGGSNESQLPNGTSVLFILFVFIPHKHADYHRHVATFQTNQVKLTVAIYVPH